MQFKNIIHLSSVHFYKNLSDKQTSYLLGLQMVKNRCIDFA